MGKKKVIFGNFLYVVLFVVAILVSVFVIINNIKINNLSNDKFEDIGQLLGPFCFNNTCLVDDARNFCQNIGGENIANRWCFINDPDKKFEVHEFCVEGGGCLLDDARAFCERKGGHNVGDRWCVLTKNKL